MKSLVRIPRSKLLEVSPEIRPADRAGEEHVAAEDERGLELVADENDRAGTVSRYLAHLELEAREFDAFSIGDQPFRVGTGEWLAEGAAHVGLGVAQQSRLVASDHERRLGECLFHRPIARDVVERARACSGSRPGAVRTDRVVPGSSACRIQDR